MLYFNNFYNFDLFVMSLFASINYEYTPTTCSCMVCVVSTRTVANNT
jgi:hypothetical protein